MGAAEALQVTREPHQAFPKPVQRIRYIMDLMVSGQFERVETAIELAEDWGISLNTAHTYTTQATRQLELLGQREHVLELVRKHAADWVSEAGGDRVPAAKLLLETVGGLVQRHEHKVEVAQRSDSELFAMMLSEVRADPVLRAKAIAFLTAENPDMELLTAGESVDE